MEILENFSEILSGSILVTIYLVYQLPVFAAASLFARRFRPRNWFEFLTAAGFLYALFTIAISGVLGLFGGLTATGVFLCSTILGACAFVTERKRPALRLPKPEFTVPELLLLCMAAAFIGYQWRSYSYLPAVGTDALIYHLYYPAVWLQSGFAERISQPGYMTASYPCYGEFAYAWQMAGVNVDFFAKNYQFYFLILGFFAAVAAGIAAGFRRIEALAAAMVLVFTGVVFRNATVANTDLITGSFLLCAVGAGAIGARRNRLGWFLLSGAGFGLAAGTKFLGFMLAPPAFLILAVAIWLLRPGCRKFLSWMALTAAVTGAPCFVANWIVAGNPVYPARIGIGGWTLFPNFMELSAPAIGCTREAWSFFVNTEVDNMSLLSALLLLACVLAALTAGFGKRRRNALISFRRGCMVTAGVMFVLLLAIQLEVYPSMTQPRQIIPLAMLAALGAMELVRRMTFPKALRSPWFAAAAIMLLCALASVRQMNYLSHGRMMLFYFAVLCAFAFALAFWRCRAGRVAVILLSGLFLLLDGGYRYGVCNALSSEVRAGYLGSANETVRKIINQFGNEAGRGATVVYCGAFYYHFLGDWWEHRIVTPPVTASGKEHNWEYPGFEAMREPGSFEVWFERLRRENADFLLVDLKTFAGANPRLELEWALSHPELFPKVFEADGLTLFRIRGERR